MTDAKVINNRKLWISAQLQAIRNGKSDGFFCDKGVICPECGFEQNISKVAGVSPFPCWPAPRAFECQHCKELFTASCHVNIEYTTVRFGTG